uniref:Uncharacterized protein n=1 Tax=Noctiluca scintillans TaxID=2966 RepID=A0A7S1AT21_NOCSC
MAVAQCEVRVPEHVLPGESFVARTPDGQQMEVHVPIGSVWSPTISFQYVPIHVQCAESMPPPPGSGGLVLSSSAATPPPEMVGTPVVGKVIKGGARVADKEAAQDHDAVRKAWMLYGVGWCMCCCFGPLSLIFWYAVPILFLLKSETERRRQTEERVVAVVSAVTAGVCTIVTMIMFLVIISNWSSLWSVSESKCQSDYQIINGCFDCSYTEAGVFYGRRRSEFSHCAFSNQTR